MLVGRVLYILGWGFVLYSLGILIVMVFTTSGNSLIALFSLLNGLIAVGVGDIVIDLNYRKKFEMKNNKRSQ